MLKPTTAPTTVESTITIEREGRWTLEVFADIQGCDKALYCADARELHVPAHVGTEHAHTFILSLIYALTLFAEALGITDPAEGGPTASHVGFVAGIIAAEVCEGDFKPSAVAKDYFEVCKGAFTCRAPFRLALSLDDYEPEAIDRDAAYDFAHAFGEAGE